MFGDVAANVFLKPFVLWSLPRVLFLFPLQDAQINQTQSLVLEKGNPAHLKCKLTYNHTWMLWYRPVQEQGLQLFFYSLDRKDVQSDDTRERITASWLQAQLFYFTISSVTLNLCISVPAVQTQGFSHLLSCYKNLLFPPLPCRPQHQQEAGCQCWLPLLALERCKVGEWTVVGAIHLSGMYSPDMNISICHDTQMLKSPKHQVWY
ncbi:uncharacterized protein LOC117885270 [Trachemys scripta elegans]|uniref:uncharacterized protein LOC117885270 n=1 Tax=Trachemys scripta elegans TaxID=31138 RepID=UPI0015539D5C|nr:uncharacterized protein LOC117885270 [Trachemys scripta elegans]